MSATASSSSSRVRHSSRADHLLELLLGVGISRVFVGVMLQREFPAMVERGTGGVQRESGRGGGREPTGASPRSVRGRKVLVAHSGAPDPSGKAGTGAARDPYLYAWRRALASRSSETPKIWSAADLFIAHARRTRGPSALSFEKQDDAQISSSNKASSFDAGNAELRRVPRADRGATCRASIRTDRVRSPGFSRQSLPSHLRASGRVMRNLSEL